MGLFGKLFGFKKDPVNIEIEQFIADKIASIHFKKREDFNKVLAVEFYYYMQKEKEFLNKNVDLAKQYRNGIEFIKEGWAYNYVQLGCLMIWVECYPSHINYDYVQSLHMRKIDQYLQEREVSLRYIWGKILEIEKLKAELNLIGIKF